MSGYHYVQRDKDGKIVAWSNTKPVKNPEKVLDNDSELSALLNRVTPKSRLEQLVDKVKDDTITDAETLEAMREFLKMQ